LAVLTSYFDAAGHDGGPHALTVGGFIGDVRAWNRFTLRWRATLDKHGIKDFRMSSFMAGSKGFERFKDQPELQRAVLEELVELICKNTRFSCGTTVLANDWEQVNEEYRLTECRATPYAVAAFSVINKAIRWIGKPNRNRSFTDFVFEEGDAGRADFEWLVSSRYSELRPSFRRLVERPNDWGLMERSRIAEWAIRIGVPKRTAQWNRKAWRPFQSLDAR
jgi:hypothetical protein